MTTDEAKASIFAKLFAEYHGAGKNATQFEKSQIRMQLKIPEDVFNRAMEELKQAMNHYIEADGPYLSLGLEGKSRCEDRDATNPFSGSHLTL